jgi:hypothetical protein
MPKANPKSRLHQWSAQVRVTRNESWTVEAHTESEALEKLKSGDVVDEMQMETVDWDPDEKSLKDEGEA